MYLNIAVMEMSMFKKSLLQIGGEIVAVLFLQMISISEALFLKTKRKL